jgi:protein involved in temperature-dependent protein secretion
VVAHVDGQEVEELRDVDERYGPCLEFLAGPFAWIVDWEPIRTVRFAPVLTLLDTVYRPVSLSFWAGQTLPARVPMVYPEALRDRPRFLLGLASEIQEEPSGLIVGRGGRRFWTPVGEFDLASCRQLDLRPA